MRYKHYGLFISNLLRAYSSMAEPEGITEIQNANPLANNKEGSDSDWGNFDLFPNCKVMAA